VAAISGMLYTTAAILHVYFSYSTDVAITLNQKQSLEYPAVTVCNVNPIRRTAWEEYLQQTTKEPREAHTDTADTDLNHRVKRSVSSK
jgi:hypothetical protein